MVWPIDQEAVAVEKTVCFSQFPRGGGRASQAGPHGEAPGSGRRLKGWKESVGKSLYCGLHGKKWTRSAGLELESLNNFSRQWGVGSVLSGPVPGPGVIRPGILT